MPKGATSSGGTSAKRADRSSWPQPRRGLGEPRFLARARHQRNARACRDHGALRAAAAALAARELIPRGAERAALAKARARDFGGAKRQATLGDDARAG